MDANKCRQSDHIIQAMHQIVTLVRAHDWDYCIETTRLETIQYAENLNAHYAPQIHEAIERNIQIANALAHLSRMLFPGDDRGERS